MRCFLLAVGALCLTQATKEPHHNNIPNPKKSQATQSVDFDVVVYGSSPAGISAAVAAGSLGMRVALYEPLKMIGGMGAAGNLALNDGGQQAERTGLAKNFTLLNGKAYGLDTEVAHPESFVSEASFRTLLAAANVTKIELDCRLLSVQTEKITRKQAGSSSSSPSASSDTMSRIASIGLLCESAPVTASVFIDASYDGEIMVGAGDIEYTAGREAIATYNESLAGARKPGFDGVSGPQHINALHDDGSIIKFVANISDLAKAGEADDALMAFQHRMCISGESDRVPWPMPDGYDAEDFILIQRALDATGDASFFSRMPPSKLPGMPGNKKKYCLCCGITVASTDQPILNKGWASASWEQKQTMIADHTYFELGTFYYLANDQRVPQKVRDTFNSYGLCRDEFADFGHVPPQLYVRISNRLVGDYVMTQNNMADPRNKDDSIAVGDWSLDEHMTGKYAVPVGGGKFEVQLEGNFWPSVRNGTNWYDVPYKIMVPKAGTGTNLLVPVCLSASAVAYTSARIENMFMNVGSAAGVAALQMVNGEVDAVQDVDVAKVQEILEGTFHQRLHGPPFGNAPEVCDLTNTSVVALTIAGADSGASGRYLRTTDKYDGLPVFRLDATHQLYRSDGVWRIADLGQYLLYVADGVVGRGNGPPPPVKGVWHAADQGVGSPPTSIVCETA